MVKPAEKTSRDPWMKVSVRQYPSQSIRGRYDSKHKDHHKGKIDIKGDRRHRQLGPYKD